MNSIHFTFHETKALDSTEDGTQGGFTALVE